jgi:hypothetical protein
MKVDDINGVVSFAAISFVALSSTIALDISISIEVSLQRVIGIFNSIII